jgi:hypothetical protein
MKKVIILVIFLIIAAALRLYSTSEMHFPLNPYIDTIFTKDFTIEKFNTVNKGMSKEEVQKLLGEPLYSNNSREMTCNFYSTDGKVEPFADFSFYSFVVCFKGDKVDSKNVNEFFN